MTDGELEHHYLELLEKAVGSAAAFPTADAFASAALNAINDMNEEFGRPRDDQESWTWKDAREHWQRQRWFRVHGEHGAPTYSKTWYSPGLEAKCQCGADLRLYRELVPVEWQKLMP